MSDRAREASKSPRPTTTILDPLRPAVVVRRRVYDATSLEKRAEPTPPVTPGASRTPRRLGVEDE
ncbi:MAG TPA: hypothetical protein VM580_23375, partial [Labilithrix sp.]|nr:hypothetical protein [Labilithrix sp.]